MLYGVVDENLSAEPVPVDLVKDDAIVREFHDLTDIDQITIRRGLQILPRRGTTVPQIAQFG